MENNKKRPKPYRLIIYQELMPDCDCERCLGCSLLEMQDFVGKYNCDNFRRGVKDNERK